MSTVEGRLTDALAARAHLEVLDAEALRHHRTQVLAEVGTTGDDVVSLGRAGAVSATEDDDALAAVLADARGASHHRLRLVLAAAAAVVVLAAASLGIAQVSQDTTPAASPAASYAALSRPQQPIDLLWEAGRSDDIVPSSIRRLGGTGAVTYWAGFTSDRSLCWAVLSEGSDAGGCVLGTMQTPEAIPLGGTTDEPTAWLVPDGYDVRDLLRQGFAELAPSLWVPAGVAGSGLDQFAVLRAPQQPADAFGGAVRAEDYLAGSGRVLLKTAEATFWAALDPGEQVCLVVLLNRSQVAGSSCAPPAAVALHGVFVGLSGGSPTVTAWLAPDALDTSAWSGEGRIQLGANLWVDPASAEAAAETDIRAASADTFVVEPFVGRGTQELPVLADEGTYAVVVRCLSSPPMRVEVDGVRESPTFCDDGWSSPPGIVATVVEVDDVPVTVAVTAQDDAAWAAGMVRCSPVVRQCPTVPGRLW